MATFELSAHDGSPLFARYWATKGKPNAILQIAHGMAEHSGRYERFAKFLNAHGIAVYAHDHRGHGATAADENTLGYYSDHDGWRKVTDDTLTLTHHIRKKHTAPPLFLLGHSMGSFIAQQYAIDYGHEIDGLILSASHGKTGLKAKLGVQLVRAEIARKGTRFRSPATKAMSFGSFNKQFKPNRTESDWLSRDEAEVDKYLADPLCGFLCQTGLWRDLLGGLHQIHRPELQLRVPRELPILLFTGSEDPVSEGAKGVEKLRNEYQQAGVRNVETRVYPGGRHEMLNETNRDEVMQDCLNWLNAATDKATRIK